MSEHNSSQFYLRHGEWSDPQGWATAYDAIPNAVSAVTSAVQGVLLHDYFGALLYPEPPSNIAEVSRATLPVSERLPTIHGFGETPLAKKRHTSSRTVGTCRDFALLTCSMLRHHGISARVRCGFARYFHPPTYEDHWICEYWCTSANRWKMVDAELDEEHRKHLSISFDVNDMPEVEFMFPWQVWEKFGDNLSLLEHFGHGEAKGLWFLHVNLARDFLALIKQEVSDWDTWRDLSEADKSLDSSAIAQCDELAAAGKFLDTARTFDPKTFDNLAARIRRPHWRS